MITFCKTCDHQIWQASASRVFASNDFNQADAGDVIMSKSRDKLKHYISTTRLFMATKLGGMITYLDGSLPSGRSKGTSIVAFKVLIINCHLEFINLFTFNCLTTNTNIFFSEKHIFRKQKRTPVYVRASLVSNFKLRGNRDLRHKKISEVLHPEQEYTKMRIPNKRYQTNTVRTF